MILENQDQKETRFVMSLLHYFSWTQLSSLLKQICAVVFHTRVWKFLFY